MDWTEEVGSKTRTLHSQHDTVLGNARPDRFCVILPFLGPVQSQILRNVATTDVRSVFKTGPCKIHVVPAIMVELCLYAEPISH